MFLDQFRYLSPNLKLYNKFAPRLGICKRPLEDLLVPVSDKDLLGWDLFLILLS